MNIVKTDLCNKLAITTLENLMRISLYSDCGENFYDCAFDKWAAVKSRRIL